MSVEFGVILFAESDNVQDLRFFNTEISLRTSSNQSEIGDYPDLKPGTVTRPVLEGCFYWLYAEQIIGLLLVDTTVRSDLGEIEACSEGRD